MRIELTDAGWIHIAVPVEAAYFVQNQAWCGIMTYEIDKKNDLFPVKQSNMKKIFLGVQNPL